MENFLSFRGTSGNGGMSFRKGQKFWPRIFEKFAFETIKREWSMIDPLSRRRYSEVQRRFYKRRVEEITKTQHKNMTKFCTTTRFKRRSTLYISLLVSAFSVLYFRLSLSANLPLLRQINHISPLVLSMPLCLSVYFCSIWLFICVLYRCIREIGGEGGGKKRIILTKFRFFISVSWF